MWKRLLSGIIVSLALCTNLYAGPALQEFIDVKQPDGSIIKARQQGDEFQHWTETKSGHTILRNPATKFWDYAEKDSNGKLKASGYRVLAHGVAPAHLARRLKPPRNQALELHQKKTLNTIYQERIKAKSSSSIPSRSPLLKAAPGDWSPTPVAGAKNVLLILVNFANRPLVTDSATWGEELYSPGAKSVLRYYIDNSFDSLTIAPATHSQAGPAGVVTVTIAANHPNGDKSYATESNILNLALAQAATYVNFSAYDVNDNASLEPSELAIYLIFAGYEQSGSNKIPSVWAHAWGGDGVTASGLAVTDWALNGELSNSGLAHPMGVIAHELGHALCGLPDLYDTSGNNAGMGIFSLMASGSWGANTTEDAGTTPTALDLWSREYLGWAAPMEPVAPTTITINSSLIAPDAGYKFITAASDTEYFLLENRQPAGWDLGAKKQLGSGWTGGLLLTHIDTTAGTVGSNDINSFTASGGRQGVTPVQADATSCDMISSFCWGAATTLFYAANHAAWTPRTAPDSNYYDGTPANFSLTSISTPTTTMTADWSMTPFPPQPVTEDFESGDLSKLPWLISGNGDWTVTANGYHSVYAAEAPQALGDNQSAILETSVITTAGNITFRYAVESEPTWDFLIFAIDGAEKGRWSGMVDWSRAVFAVDAGSHTLTWTYLKDESTSVGLDTAWVDDLSLPVEVHELSVLRTGSGSVTPDNGTLIWTDNSGSALYNHGNVVTLTAEADPGSTFIGWDGACSGIGTCQVTMDDVRNVTANFTIISDRLLTVSKSGSGSVTPDSGTLTWDSNTGTETYTDNTIVTLTATADPGNIFSGWGGACSGTGTCQVTMDDVRNVTANFTIIGDRLLTVSKSGSGSVTPDSGTLIWDDNTGTETYTDHTVVTLTATADPGSIFSGWSGACSGTGPCQVTMDDVRNVSASFYMPISINAGAEITSSVTFKLGLNYPPGAVKMRFCFNNKSWTAWGAYATTKSVIAPAGDGLKTVSVQFLGATGEESPVFSDTILLDSKTPVGTITLNQGDAITTTATVTATLAASDSNGVTAMQFSQNGTIWGPWEAYASSKEFTLSPAFGTKKVWVRFRDEGGKISAAVFDSILYQANDLPVPEAGAYLAAPAYVTTTTVTVTITAPPGDVTSMQFSQNGSTGWSAWEGIKATKKLVVSSGDGIKPLYVHFKTAAGAISSIYGTTTILDSKAPGGSLVINNGEPLTNTLDVTLTLAAADLNDVVQMQTSLTTTTWSATWEDYAPTKVLTLSNSDGLKTVYARFRDRAGKISAVVSDTITLDRAAPIGSVVINGNTTTITSLTVPLTLKASGAITMQLSLNNGSTWGEWEPYVAKKTVTLPVGDGIKTVQARFRDLIGNTSVVVSDSSSITTAPVPTSLTVPTSDSDGSYQVSWEKPAGTGITSTLEEARDSNFTLGRRVAYSGTAATVKITSRTKGLTYYYRIRSNRIGWASSEWKIADNPCAVGL